MVLTTNSGCSKISFYMKELKLPFTICWISILRVMIWSRPVSTYGWKAAVGVETTNIVVWVADGARPLYPLGGDGVALGGGGDTTLAND
jgi:hypothetical protein